MTNLKLHFLAILLLIPCAVMADDESDVIMNAEIDYLLETVGSSGCTFIRNESEHDAESAQKHLSMKRKRGKRYYDSADEFIEKLASKSSWSGDPYYIRCADDEVLAGEWFGNVLTQYRASNR
jgi:hypothetical protein